MLLFIKRKEQSDADEKMLLRLKVKHEILHSNRIDDIAKRVFVLDKNKIPKLQKPVEHIVFDLNYMLEPGDSYFLSLLVRLRNEAPGVGVTFFYFSDDEYLVNRSIESIKQIGFTRFLIADDPGDFLKKFNAFIITNAWQSEDRGYSGCISIGVLGGCERIGTTTQSLQMMMFLQKAGLRVGLIQWQSTDEISSYVEIVKGAKNLTPSEYVINGLHFYGPEDLKTALNDNDYLVFDFGNVATIGQEAMDLFLEKDIRVSVLGVKSKEVRHFSEVFALDKKGDMKYIYSFILNTDREEVKNQMGARKADTYFSEYAPDYLTYCGDNAMYSKILGVVVPQKPPQQKVADVVKTKIDNIGSGLWNKKEKKPFSE